MKTIWLRFFAICAAILPLSASTEAGVLDDLMGYIPGYGQTYAYHPANPAPTQYNAMPQYGPAPEINVAPQYGIASYTAQHATQRHVAAPQQPLARQLAYQQQVQTAPQPQTSTKGVSKKRARQGASPANAAGQPNPRPQNQVARSNKQNRAIHHGPVVRAERNVGQGNYYGNPYQFNSYYQGYHNPWGGSGLVCPPGRA